MIDRTDPETPRMFAHIWRLCHTSVYMNEQYRNDLNLNQMKIDCGYCLDRYSLIDTPDRDK